MGNRSEKISSEDSTEDKKMKNKTKLRAKKRRLEQSGPAYGTPGSQKSNLENILEKRQHWWIGTDSHAQGGKERMGWPRSLTSSLPGNFV